MKTEFYVQIRNELDFRKNWTPNVVVLSADTLLFLLGLYLIHLNHWLPFILSQFVFVVIFFHAFGILHEAVHGTVSDSRTVSSAIGNICSVFCFLPFESWKMAHLQHHRWSGNIEKDPVMRLVKTFDPTNRRQMLIYNVAWRSWLPIMAILQHLVFWSNAVLQLRDKNIGRKLKTRILLSTLLAPSVYLTLFGIWPEFFHFKNFALALVAYLSLTEVINFPHHLGRERLEEGHALPKDQYRFTRSCFYPPWVALGGLLNFNFHIEHHLYPTLPWHQLAKARLYLKEALGGDYAESHYNGWIKENRGKDMREVVLPRQGKVTEAFKKAS